MSFTLTGFPLFALVAMILMQGGTLSGTAPTVAFQNTGAVVSGSSVDCSAFSFGIQTSTGPCLNSLPAGTTITCANPAYNGLTPRECRILSDCPGNMPSGLICDTGSAALIQGSTAYVAAANAVSTSNAAVFNLGFISLTSGQAFVAIIGVIVAVAAVVGLNIFGSGESSEAIHILLMGAAFLGLWIFLTALEGFGVKADFFSQLNSAYAGLGSIFYSVLSLVYLLSFVKTVSRGL